MQEPDCVKAARESIGSEVLTSLERTAQRAQKVAADIAERMSSVTSDDPSGITGPDKALALPSYPSFFDQIRQKTDSINNSLSRIEDVMRRVEF